MAGDWIKLHRRMLDSAVMRDDWLCRLWVWCLLKASFTDRTSGGVPVKAGQFIAGRLSAAAELGVSPSRWYRGIQRLVELGNVTAKSDSNRTTITVCNWSTYQLGDAPERTAIEQQADSDRTAIEQQADTIEEGNTERTKELRTEEAKSCSEPRAASEPPVLEFPIVGGQAKTWGLTESKIAEYRESYPGVDVLAESRKALQWCRDNPAKRKTLRGMPAFLGRWFSKVQDRGGAQRPGPAGRFDLRDQLVASANAFIARGEAQ